MRKLLFIIVCKLVQSKSLNAFILPHRLNLLFKYVFKIALKLVVT